MPTNNPYNAPIIFDNHINNLPTIVMGGYVFFTEKDGYGFKKNYAIKVSVLAANPEKFNVSNAHLVDILRASCGHIPPVKIADLNEKSRQFLCSVYTDMVTERSCAKLTFDKAVLIEYLKIYANEWLIGLVIDHLLISKKHKEAKAIIVARKLANAAYEYCRWRNDDPIIRQVIIDSKNPEEAYWYCRYVSDDNDMRQVILDVGEPCWLCEYCIYVSDDDDMRTALFNTGDEVSIDNYHELKAELEDS